MKSKNFGFWFIIAAMLFQSDFFSKVQTDLPMSFVTALNQTEGVGNRLVLVFVSCLPVWFLLIFSSGNIQELLSGRGKLYLLRNMSRGRLIQKESGSVICTSLFFCAAEWVVNGIMSIGEKNSFSVDYFKIILPYFFMIVNLVLIEYMLEFALEPRIAQIITALYLTVSLIVSCTSDNIVLRIVFGIVFFPALGFVHLNRDLTGNICGIQLTALLTLSGIFVLLLVFIYVVFQKKDIL